MSSGVYQIRNTSTSDSYVGSSNDIEYRWAYHRHCLNVGTHDNIHLQRAWEKYGETSFTFEILELCDIHDLRGREQVYLDMKQPSYNISRFATAPMRERKHTEETRLKMSRSKIGKKRSLETIERIRQSKLGTTHTDEAKQKMSRARQGRTWEEIYGVEVANELRRRRAKIEQS